VEQSLYLFFDIEDLRKDIYSLILEINIY